MMERRGLQNSHLQEGNNPKVQNAFAAIDPNPVKVARDPSRIFIMGHSAGAQLVDLLATNGKYLQEQGLNTGNIKGLISLDTARLNLQERLSEDTVEGRMVGGMIKSAFGTDPSVLADASATLAIKSGASYPPFLMFCGKKPVSRTFLRGL
jgi:acetyl esterase/lipase